MKIVLMGAGGKLGASLHRDWAERHDVEAVTRNEVDLRDGEALRKFLEARDFDALVNCAAMASPEACEANAAEAELVNMVAPGLMAGACARMGVRFVHFSTDYVVDGRVAGLKDEFAQTKATGYYGSSKLHGELRVLEEDPGALICRVSWVFGEGMPSFLPGIVSRARNGEALEAVGDKWSKPTSAADISRSVETLLGVKAATGVVHLVNEGEPESWCSYARKVLQLAREVGLLEAEVEVRESRLADVPQLSAPRPTHTALCSRRLPDWLGAPLPRWEDRAVECLRALAVGECH